MKRFYKQATVSPEEGGVAILLDGRPVRTPARNLLRLPTEELAEAIAAEWNAQGEKIDPHAMPLTGLANAAIDRVAPDPAAFGRSLAEYGESDLLCYRAEGPQSLVERQSRVWDPLLGWARTRFAVEIETTAGVMHRRQPARTVAMLGRAVAARGPFQLAGLAPLVTIAGSLIIALALAEGAIGLETAWDAAMLDEAWQAEQWGVDPLAAASLENRRREFEAAYRFLTLL
ncbi:MAG TPA: ATP12 family protein [Allosphingosinicella sp.]|nr:ATP12 family protein [Allosphingosinicella sp.]